MVTWAGIPLYRDGTAPMLGFTAAPGNTHIHVVWPHGGAKVAIPVTAIVALNGEPYTAVHGGKGVLVRKAEPAVAPPPPGRRRRRQCPT